MFKVGDKVIIKKNQKECWFFHEKIMTIIDFSYNDYIVSVDFDGVEKWEDYLIKRNFDIKDIKEYRSINVAYIEHVPRIMKLKKILNKVQN